MSGLHISGRKSSSHTGDWSLHTKYLINQVKFHSMDACIAAMISVKVMTNTLSNAA